MTFKLPKLPYSYDALEPYIDKETMKIHYSKHHAAYIHKLNDTLESVDSVEDKSIENILKDIDSIPEEKKQLVINHGGGHANHSLFWEIMTPDAPDKPDGELFMVIENTFGSYEDFKDKFTEKAITLFGSGWVFLVVTKDKTLEVTRQSFQNSPLMHDQVPILGLDLWEHAYYLKYQNKRAEYIEAWWNLVNWKEVEKKFLEIK
jgi:Fe-Mn family superoxide dismutase